MDMASWDTWSLYCARALASLGLVLCHPLLCSPRVTIERASLGPLDSKGIELLMQKLICKHKGLIPDLNVKACQQI